MANCSLASNVLIWPRAVRSCQLHIAPARPSCPFNLGPPTQSANNRPTTSLQHAKLATCKCVNVDCENKVKCARILAHKIQTCPGNIRSPSKTITHIQFIQYTPGERIDGCSQVGHLFLPICAKPKAFSSFRSLCIALNSYYERTLRTLSPHLFTPPTQHEPLRNV